jgi:DNA modification methylase
MGSLYRSQHELIFVFKVGTAPHINNIELGRSGRYRTNAWNYPGVNTFGRDRLQTLAMHPTVKPVALVADAIKDCSRRNDIVFDPFIGSGTTIIAAEKSNRRTRGIEIDPAYVDVAIRRWQKLTGGTAFHAPSDRSFSDLIDERTAGHSDAQIGSRTGEQSHG